MTTGFYTFDQNNTGGSFDFDQQAGITTLVIIEAHSHSDAITRAESIGIYFDGVRDGRDCPCCGDRWCEPWGEPNQQPKVYGTPVADYRGFQWMPDGEEICVHYLDGRKEWFGAGPESN